MTPAQERIGWLRTLISSYDSEHDWGADEDPTATQEMLRECHSLADDLEGQLPPEQPETTTEPDPSVPF